MNTQPLSIVTQPRSFPDGVTIAIPNWNHELLLPRSITSALQAVKQLAVHGIAAEVLVLDDCSRDGSLTLLRQLEALLFDAGLRVLALAQNAGLGRTRNTALHLAKYRYIAFLDADNELIPENTYLFYRAICETQAALVYGNLLCPDTATRPPRLISNESVRDRLFADNYIDACVLSDRVQLLDCGEYQTGQLLHGWDDYELNLHLITQGRKLVFVPLAFAVYHELPQSLITEFNQHSDKGYQRMRRMFNQLGIRHQMPYNGPASAVSSRHRLFVKLTGGSCPLESLSPEVRQIWPTLTSCYRPIESYVELLAEAGGAAEQPQLNLSALDAFLLHQLVSALPMAPIVIDLAAEATNGASAAFWLASASAHRLIVPHLSALESPSANWRQHFPAIAEVLNWRLEQCNLTVELPALSELTPTSWPSLSASLNPLVPSVVLCAAHEATAAVLANVLNSVFNWQLQALVVLLGFGKVGDHSSIKAALDYCAAHPEYRLTMLRELSPFFFASSVGIVHPINHAELRLLFDRLQYMYEGNFQFLTLAKALTETVMQSAPQVKAHTTFAMLRSETKRWLWHRVLPRWFKCALNRLRKRPED